MDMDEDEGYSSSSISECVRIVVSLMEDFNRRFSIVHHEQKRLRSAFGIKRENVHVHTCRFGQELERKVVRLVLEFAKDSLEELSLAVARATEEKQTAWDDFCG